MTENDFFWRKEEGTEFGKHRFWAVAREAILRAFC